VRKPLSIGRGVGERVRAERVVADCRGREWGRHLVPRRVGAVRSGGPRIRPGGPPPPGGEGTSAAGGRRRDGVGAGGGARGGAGRQPSPRATYSGGRRSLRRWRTNAPPHRERGWGEGPGGAGGGGLPGRVSGRDFDSQQVAAVRFGRTLIRRCAPPSPGGRRN